MSTINIKEHNKLNDRLVFFRKNKGFTQKKLSELAGISEPTMNHYESGKRVPTVDTLLNLARILECDPGWLLTGGESPALKQEPASTVRKDTGGFVFVPQYDLGLLSNGASIQSSQVVDHLAFKRDWVVQELRSVPDQLLLIRCTGDAMEPTIKADDLLLVDRSPEKKREDGIFLIHIDGGLYVRRVERRLEGGLTIRGDKTGAAPEEKIPREKEKQLDLIGRIVWVGRRL
ncbi:MAG: helix-turn-helix transcriptional regulator [Candidatus Nitronauta litoralis]|uniref:Helix-turn-helix transcriptional regulator n=1 Tax=Candidatus Nitronauta litoralis TaxID=2705533 RepID=A0A7T0G1L7_9BACT|nr:MAG: helix-turn-helix transcriptional regulator [Candidatus Nitronauta litoralis]